MTCGLLSVTAFYRPPLPNGYPGTTLQVGRTSTNALSVATVKNDDGTGTNNLPGGWTYTTGSRLVRINTSASDWDFRNLNVNFAVQVPNVVLSQNLFDLKGYTQSNASFIKTTINGAYYSVTNCTFDGIFSAANITALLNGVCILADSNSIVNWPQDVFDIAPMTLRPNSTSVALNYGMRVDSAPHLDFVCTTAGITASSEPAAYTGAVNLQQITDGTAVFTAQNTKHYVRNNFVSITGLGPLHPDFSQIQATSWSSGADLEINNNIGIAVSIAAGGAFAMQGFFYGGNGSNIGVDFSIHDNVIVAGTNDVHANWGGQGATITGSAEFSKLYVNTNNGVSPFQTVQSEGPNLTISNVIDYTNGAAVTFPISQQISTESKTIGTGVFVFSSIIAGTKTSQWTNGAAITLFTNNNGTTFLASITGTVTSFTGGTLTLNITSSTGSGTFTSWVEKLTGLTSYP